MTLELLAQVSESPAHDPLAQPDRRGDLTLLAHPPDTANADAQELRHLADIDDRDLRLSILKFIHECTRVPPTAGRARRQAQDNGNPDAPRVGVG